ncbi:MAG: hypothetical protein K8F60_14640 [Melioribacteraceae bacterium]|jgi:hypothetical protein|nr:hypothetical protein [Ignavibacteriota bacterium]MBZ0183694.1 hypothetical protein [Melioribacteraceae bacterium]|tara:strand:- start:70 stop:501 length:432 start_codon:yes stop_codon:yes gene_type:complete
MKYIYFLLLLSGLVTAQTNTANWKPIYDAGGQSLYIDVEDLSRFTGDDVYVWARQKFSIPIVIETISEKIHYALTYYLINKKLQRYSMLEVIYYDEDFNVLKSFSYNRKSTNEGYQYNYPILKGSDVEMILNKCMEYIPNEKK